MCAQIAQLATNEVIRERKDRIASGTTYGYLRVSDRETDKGAQISALQAEEIEHEHIFADIGEADGPDSQYGRLVKMLRSGDTLIIPSLDVLGKTYADVIAQWQALTKIMHIHVAVRDIPELDTRKTYDVDGDFLPDLTLQFLAYAALREREHIRRRQHEGIVAAMERGVRFGRPPKPIPAQFEDVLRQWRRREISSRKAAQQLGVAQETFLRWSRRQEYQHI